jgi:hypothetical protein
MIIFFQYITNYWVTLTRWRLIFLFLSFLDVGSPDVPATSGIITPSFLVALIGTLHFSHDDCGVLATNVPNLTPKV